MGFDLDGKSGNYFRANIWSWRPIVNLIHKLNALKENDLIRISSNDGHKISKRKALEISVAIDKFLKIHKEKYLNHFGNMTDKELTTDKFYTEDDDFDKNYWTDREHLTEFVKFCKESEGFNVY